VARNAPQANSAQNAFYIIAITQGTLATAVSAHQHQTGGTRISISPLHGQPLPGRRSLSASNPDARVSACATLVPRQIAGCSNFGRQMMIFEEDLYTNMSQLCADYTGSYWNFYDLSNGGCYLAPSGAESYRICVSIVRVSRPTDAAPFSIPDDAISA
jgi:hypothetical protein